MTKAIAILPVVSAIYPIKIGATAPPTMVMMSNDDAILVWVPASLKAKEKIVGNMMLSPKYKAKKAIRDVAPLQVTTIDVAMMVSKAHAKSTNFGLM